MTEAEQSYWCSFGASCRSIRKALRWSMENVAEDMGGVSKGWVAHAESGQRRVSLYRAQRLAEVLGVMLEDLTP